MKRTPFAIGEYYHIYNRGTDKREIFLCREDLDRFFLCMQEFNCIEPIGSIFEIIHSKRKFGGEASKKSEGLVEFVAYCLNPNHYHFILKEVVDRGIAKYMQRLGTGYTMYFNEKYQRNGSLFQGPYKAKHTSTNEYLLHLSVYVNLNFLVHRFGGLASKLWKSSWGEYSGREKVTKNFCKKDIILNQYSSTREYISSAKETLADILERKESEGVLRDLLLEASPPNRRG